ncbi:MAG TPA: PHB depolymerase family esterase [Acidimicrobiia bacterium]|nr:PHB depolymerase family esterase [Acidimicrobiia bacterium]
MLKRPLAGVIALALLLGACSSELTTGKHLLGNHTVDRNRDMPYLLWLPEGMERTGEEHPMIVSLHGTGPTAYSPEFVMSYGLPAVLALEEQPEDFDFVVVAPQGLDGVDWWSSGQPEEVNEIVDEIVADIPIDTDRIYLTGFSTGGQGAWHLAARYPDKYAAVVSVGGSGFRSTNGEVSEASCGLSPVPVWGIHGEDDLISVLDVVQTEVEDWEELCQTTARWTTYPGVGHFQSFEIAYRDPAVYTWMLEHSLD